MHVTNKMIYIFLALISVLLIGMLLESWRIILYPYLLTIGLMLLFGLWKPIKRHNNKMTIIPIVVTVAYLLAFLTLDFITRHSLGGGEQYILGLTPSMALYLLTILPGGGIVCLLFALSFEND